ncbi:MAG: ABC transporter permease [Streptosporangiales bacterium]|nr:ABC transporter permease [Streptosporangiales bacterium]
MTGHPVLLAGALAVALWAVAALISPGFASYPQVLNLLTVSAFLGVIAIGQTIVILSGGEGIDLSVGAVATLAAIVASRVMEGSNANLVQGILFALVAAACVGLVNGVGITFFRVPPLVMTLGMIGVVQGAIRLYTGGQPKGSVAPALRELVAGNTVLGIPGVLWLWLGLILGVLWLLRRTTFGWRVYAMGAGRRTAYLSGVRVRRMVLGVYTLSSVFAGVGGLLLLGYTQSVFLRLADGYMLPSIAAVVVGGTALVGGVGGYLGTAVGAVLLTVLGSFLDILQIGESGSDAPRQIIYGAVLLAVLSVYGRGRRLRS